MKRIEKFAILWIFKGLVCAPLSSYAPTGDKTVFVSIPASIQEGSIGSIQLFSFSPIEDTFKVVLPFGSRDTFNFFPTDSFNQSRFIPVPTKIDTNFFVIKIFNKTDTILRGIWIDKKVWPTTKWAGKKPRSSEVKVPVDSIAFWVNNFPVDTKPFNGELVDPMDRDLYITDVFGVRRVSRYRTKIHYGIDYRAEKFTPIYASSSGIVSLARNSFGWGKTIMLRHGGDVETLYLHLSKFAVIEGDTVKACDLIGYSGASGYSVTGPHLHFTVRVAKVPVDPESFKSVLR